MSQNQPLPIEYQNDLFTLPGFKILKSIKRWRFRTSYRFYRTLNWTEKKLSPGLQYKKKKDEFS